MSYAVSNGVRLYYEESGSGQPIIFVHEFGSDLREWEHQVRWFDREYRCIRFNARGYPPSDVPEQANQYGQDLVADDIAAVMDAAGISKAHVVGLSMGAFATLHFGFRHPQRALSLVLAGVGSGAVKRHYAHFRKSSLERAERFLKEGSNAVALEMGMSPTRIRLKLKDPRAWDEFVAHLSEHSAVGSANTLKNYQAARPSLFDLEQSVRACAVPTFIICGDEDDPCLEPSLYLKQTMPNANLWMVPGTGHAVNLEEPAAFNDQVYRFISAVDRGCNQTRDPRTFSKGSEGPWVTPKA